MLVKPTLVCCECVWVGGGWTDWDNRKLTNTTEQEEKKEKKEDKINLPKVKTKLRKISPLTFCTSPPITTICTFILIMAGREKEKKRSLSAV